MGGEQAKMHLGVLIGTVGLRQRREEEEQMKLVTHIHPNQYPQTELGSALRSVPFSLRDKITWSRLVHTRRCT